MKYFFLNRTDIQNDVYIILISPIY